MYNFRFINYMNMHNNILILICSVFVETNFTSFINYIILGYFVLNKQMSKNVRIGIFFVRYFPYN